MKNQWLNIKQEIAKQLNIDISLIEESEKYGDFAVPCFKIAKDRDPKEFAKELSKKLKINLIEKVQAVGPYINFYVDWKSFSKQLIETILDEKEKYGSNDSGKGKNIIIDMISLNPNKTAHIGHVRNACLSDSLAKILKFSGYKVTGQSYVNDLGMPTAALFWAIKNIPDELPKKEGWLSKEDHWQGAVYLYVDKLMKEDPEIKKQVSKLLSKLENREDLKLNEEQRELAEKCLKAQNKTWERLGIWFDMLICESDIIFSGLSKMAFEKLKEKGAVYLETEGENKGCWLLKLKQYDAFKGMENPDKILLKSDGTTTYTANDIGLHMWKLGVLPNLLKFKLLTEKPKQWITSMKGETLDLKFDKAIDVIGNEQAYAMQAKYYAFKSIGLEKEFENSYHLGYGLVGFGGEAKLSSRKGVEGLSADEIFDKVVEKAYKEVEKRNPNVPEGKKKQIAEKIGIGAIKYWMIKANPIKFITFDWDKALKFEGNTGPYLQYSYVRAKKILDKAGTDKDLKADFSVLKEKEVKLLKQLAKFPDIVKSSSNNYSPSTLANYAFNLCSLFSTFYEECPVITSEENTKKMRLLIVKSFRQVLENCLYLLGMKIPDIM